jgi:hypothetical protein
MFLDPKARLYFQPSTDESYMDYIHSLAHDVGTFLKSHHTILVNAQNVWTDIGEIPDAEAVCLIDSQFALIPCPKPPYCAMWLESIQHGARVGAFVLRQELDDSGRHLLRSQMEQANPIHREDLLRRFDQSPPRSVANGHAFFEFNASLLYMGRFAWWMNDQGSLTCSYLLPSKVTSYQYADQCLQSQLAWTLMTMARLNCHNVELRPAKDTTWHKHQNKVPKAPFSVWHEIVVKEGPEIRAVRDAQVQNPADAEKHAVRLHKVRGHFADYRNGSGLFGKYKVLVWVEEHHSGQPEAGTVVASYRVE